MTSDVMEWWGLRLRLPPGYAPKPVSAVERVALATLSGAALNAVWLGVLMFWPKEAGFSVRVLMPVAMLAITAAAALLMPERLLERSGVATWVVLSREKGGIRTWDVWMALLSAVGAVAAVFHVTPPLRAATILMLLELVLSSIALASQERVKVTGWRWIIEVPDWLRQIVEENRRRVGDGGEIIEPDPDASPLYQFEAKAGTEYPVGVRIAPEVLQRLREINAAAHGQLYATEPLAVTLMDRDPAESVGREEVLRFTAQILSAARKDSLTRLQFANAVLVFVQRAICYQFDKDSTAEFVGGPFQDYGRFAVETIHDQVGDCECTSLLCATLLAYLGFEAALLWVVVPQDGNQTANHMAVGVEMSEVLPARDANSGLDIVEATDNSGKRYLYGETAIDDATLPFGCIPAEWSGLKIEKTVAINGVKVRGSSRN